MQWLTRIEPPLVAPSVLVTPVADAAARRAALRDLAAAALAVPPATVVIGHEEGHAPVLRAPAGRRVHLSSASRGGMAAVAVGPGPIGVDIEIVEAGRPAADIPVNVLEPRERRALAAIEEPLRWPAFLRLWTVKEAYLKALGRGLDREPASFAVLFNEKGEGTVADPLAPDSVYRVETSALTRGGVDIVVSAVTAA